MNEDGQVVIVDEFTGRLMPGRRWSDGLHQAVEAKEKVKIERENQTLATITFQNYFRMYRKLAGMTGTAETEAPEFDKIYKLDVLAIPTNRPLIRVEHADVVYRTEPEKFDAVVAEIKELNAIGRPVLVGTISIEKSEHLSALLKRHGIKHVVLNAKYHEREAEIVAQAGRFGAVTIATNMAGRGTDIILGGVPDHRMKAILHEKEIDARAGHAGGQAGRPGPDPARRWPGTSRRPWRRRTSPAEERRTLAKRYVGILAAFAADHPSVLVMEALAPEPPGPGAPTSTATRVLPRPTKEKIARAASIPRARSRWTSWRSIPLQADIDRIARHPGFDKVEAFLDDNERERVVALGGLHILATERHEARRIDNQLRGRAGRQGDPGSSRFYLSLEDDLMRIFGSDRISGLMLKLGHGGGRAHRARHGHQVHRARAEAGGGAELRRPQAPPRVRRRDEQAAQGHLRHAPHDPGGQGQPRSTSSDLAREVLDWYLDIVRAPRTRTPSSGTWRALQLALKETFGLDVPLDELTKLGRGEMAEQPSPSGSRRRYEEKERQVGAELMLFHQRMIMLQIVDTQWKDHLYALDHLKEGIGLRGYGQRDPLVEYKKESYNMFQALTDRIDEEILRWVFLYQPVGGAGRRGRRTRGGPAADRCPSPDAARRARRPAGCATAARPREARAGPGRRAPDCRAT